MAALFTPTSLVLTFTFFLQKVDLFFVFQLLKKVRVYCAVYMGQMPPSLAALLPTLF